MIFGGIAYTSSLNATDCTMSVNGSLANTAYDSGIFGLLVGTNVSFASCTFGLNLDLTQVTDLPYPGFS